MALPASILPKEFFYALIDAFAFSPSTGRAGGCLANRKPGIAELQYRALPYAILIEGIHFLHEFIFGVSHDEFTL